VRIAHVKQVLGWTFPWVSLCTAADFNFDFGVSFKKEDISAGRATASIIGTPIKSEDYDGRQYLCPQREGRKFFPHLLDLMTTRE